VVASGEEEDREGVIILSKISSMYSIGRGELLSWLVIVIDEEQFVSGIEFALDVLGIDVWPIVLAGVAWVVNALAVVRLRFRDSGTVVRCLRARGGMRSDRSLPLLSGNCCDGGWGLGWNWACGAERNVVRKGSSRRAAAASASSFSICSENKNKNDNILYVKNRFSISCEVK